MPLRSSFIQAFALLFAHFAVIVHSSPAIIFKDFFTGKIPIQKVAFAGVSIAKFVPTYILKGYADVHLDTSNWDAKDDNLDNVRNHMNCGGMIQSVYDTFNSNPVSKFYGKNIIGNRKRVQEFVDYCFADYQFVDVLKCAQTDLEGDIGDVSPFIGFIAYSKRQKDLRIVFRGTVTDDEWATDASFFGEEWISNSEKRYTEIDPPSGWLSTFKAWRLCEFPTPGKIIAHRGFKRLYESDRVKAQRKTLEKGQEMSEGESEQQTKDGPRQRCRDALDKIPSDVKSITITGHSLGAGLAYICAVDIAERLLMKNRPDVMVDLVGFATPKTFTSANALFKRLPNLTFYHYYNRGDIVPMLMPGRYYHPKTTEVRHFDPVKINVIDTKYTSKILVPSVTKAGAYHNLEHILQNIQIRLGENFPEWQRDPTTYLRDVSLMNKSDKLLDLADEKNEGILNSWWSAQVNNGMIPRFNGTNKVREARLDEKRFQSFKKMYRDMHGPQSLEYPK